MKISWGTKIALLYTSFVVLILALVAASARKQVNLVADNYYQQEVVFQQRINATQARVNLSDSVTVETNADDVVLHFPAVFQGKAIAADVHFYAIADGSGDRLFSMTTNTGILSVSRQKLARLPYEVQVSWMASGTAYYQAVPLNLR